MKKKTLTLFVLCILAATLAAQERRAQNKPYIDLRTLHFGLLVGLNAQDMEFENVGPQTITAADGTQSTQTIVCDADKWNPGLTVGIVAELRLNAHFSLRATPSMHFGSKHLVFRNLSLLDADGSPHEETQDLKNTYISVPIGVKFSALRLNNHRPYILAGLNTMYNLTGKDQDIIRVKRLNTMVEVGVGCDFYLPFFKLIPELKFCYGLGNAIDTNHANDLTDTNMRAYANSVSRGQNKMFVLTFYFE